jgi:hypothetical protein
MSHLARLLVTLVAVFATEVSGHTTAFGPGEQVTFRASFLGIPAGTIQITVGADFPDRPGVWPIVALARSDVGLFFFPIKDKVVIQWDADQARTLGMEMWADENHRRQRIKFTFDHGDGTAAVVYQREGQNPSQKQVAVETGTADIASALYLLRTRPLEPGTELVIPIVTTNKQFPLRVVVERREMLRTVLGERSAVRVRLTTDFSGNLRAKRDMVVYFTDDQAHVPLRIEADLALGSVVAELTEFHSGRSVSPRPEAAARPEVH